MPPPPSPNRAKAATEHYQLRRETAKRIYTRSKAMKEGIIKHIGNPFSVTSDLTELINISSNTVLPLDSHVIKRDSIGTEMYRDFVTLRLLPVLGRLRGLYLWYKMRKKNMSLCFNATATVQCRMKDKVIELREERGSLTRFLLIQQKRPEMMNLEEAIGEYEFICRDHCLLQMVHCIYCLTSI